MTIVIFKYCIKTNNRNKCERFCEKNLQISYILDLRLNRCLRAYYLWAYLERGKSVGNPIKNIADYR